MVVDQRMCPQDPFARTPWSVSTWPIRFDAVWSGRSSSIARNSSPRTPAGGALPGIVGGDPAAKEYARVVDPAPRLLLPLLQFLPGQKAIAQNDLRRTTLEAMPEPSLILIPPQQLLRI